MLQVLDNQRKSDCFWFGTAYAKVVEMEKIASNTETPPQTPAELLASLVNASFYRAKWWSCCAIGLHVLNFAICIFAIFLPGSSLSYYPWLGLPLAFCATLVAASAGKYRSGAELLKRQTDVADGLGKAPSTKSLAETKHNLGKLLKPHIQAALQKGNEFASDKPHGAHRVLENLVECTWFSRLQAHWCAQRLLASLVICLTISVASLLWCVSNAQSPETGGLALSVSKCISATLLSILSVGIMRSWRGFSSFSEKSKSLEQQAEQLLAKNDVEVFDAYRLLTEYQLARASAPLIPTWVWKWRGKQLNEDFKIRNQK